MQSELQRVTFTTSRELEFFTEKELSMQIGHPAYMWPVALTKELIDNALDACENAGIAPVIEVTQDGDALSVRDSGPGLPESTLRHSLDYMVRVSDKAYYVSPSRGQLGNALKCVWAAPYVASGGQAGRVEVITGGTIYTVNVHLDRIAQRPQIELLTSPDGLVKTGTLIRMHGREIACCEVPQYSRYSYKNLGTLLRGYSLFNPHATLTLWPEGETLTPTAPTWRKWRPSDPTSPHWYTAERLRSLIAAYVNDERKGGRPRTVREFVSEFGGLSGTAKQKAVTDAAGLGGAYLHDLIDGRDIAAPMVDTLLRAMQAEARPVKAAALGCIGDAHMTGALARHYCVDAGKTWYKCIEGDAGGLPFVLEVAFGIYTKDYQNCGREVAIGLN